MYQIFSILIHPHVFYNIKDLTKNEINDSFFFLRGNIHVTSLTGHRNIIFLSAFLCGSVLRTHYDILIMQ